MTRQRHPERRQQPWEDKSRDRNYAVRCQGIPGATRTGKGREGSSPTSFGGGMALPTLWFQNSSLQNCERPVSVVLSHQFVVLCSSSRRKLIQFSKQIIHTAGASRINWLTYDNHSKALFSVKISLLKILPSPLSHLCITITSWHRTDSIIPHLQMQNLKLRA